MRKEYVHRLIETEILSASKEFPAIILTGPRQTGKTTMLKTIFSDYHYITLDDPLIRKFALTEPKLFLEDNSSPLIIDEIQYVPELLPYLKIAIDTNRTQNGKYILTGSQIFNLMAGITESLAGRTAIYELLGFSLEEIPSKQLNNILTCFETIFTGFFPETCIHQVNLNTFYSSYIQTYLERDIRQITSVHDLRIFQQFLELLAARIGSLLNLNEIAKECGITQSTAKRWLSLLENTRIIYLLKPYYKNVTKRIIKSPKLYFTDTGLLSYILKYPNAQTLKTSPLSGRIFENMLIIEVLKNKLIYNQRFELYFYQDSNHNEIDLLLDFGSKFKLFEFKLTKNPQETHWKNLQNLNTLFMPNSAYLLSFYEEKITRTPYVTLYPWWEIIKIINEEE